MLLAFKEHKKLHAGNLADILTIEQGLPTTVVRQASPSGTHCVVAKDGSCAAACAGITTRTASTHISQQ